MHLDEEKCRAAEKIMEFSMNLVKYDTAECISVIVKALSRFCEISEGNEVQRKYLSLHTMLDEYEEIGNRIREKKDG